MSKVVKAIFVFATALGMANAALSLDNESELREAQAALFNENSQSGWLLLNYVDSSTVHFAAGGEGGVEDFRSQLENDQVQYLLNRVGGILEKGTLKTTHRDVFITWIGPNVGAYKRQKKESLNGDAEQILQPFHASIKATNRDNLSEETIIYRSHPLSGSHAID